MKKFLLVVLATLCISAPAFAQSAQVTTQVIATATGTGLSLQVATTAFHQITWSVTGTITTCTVAVDSSPDNSSWTAGGAIGNQTCTSGGTSPVVNVSTTWIRINVGTLTGGGTLKVFYTGTSGGSPTVFPVAITNGVSGAAVCFTSTTVESAGTLLAANSPVLGGGAGSCPVTSTNCAAVGSAASPSVAACGAASLGHFSCATNASTATCTVNTTAVTANSEIFVFESDTAVTGTALGVTCNTSTTVNPATRLLASSVAATSFTINLGTVTTNPACFSFLIFN